MRRRSCLIDPLSLGRLRHNHHEARKTIIEATIFIASPVYSDLQVCFPCSAHRNQAADPPGTAAFAQRWAEPQRSGFGNLVEFFSVPGNGEPREGAL